MHAVSPVLVGFALFFFKHTTYMYGGLLGGGRGEWSRYDLERIMKTTVPYVREPGRILI